MYYLTFSENHYTIREPHEDDEWDSGDYGLSVSLLRLRRSAPNERVLGGWLEIDSGDVDQCDDIEPGNPAYVVYVEYTDGDTFGSGGYWDVVGVYADPDEALDKEQKLGTSNDTAYRPWDGYFASFGTATTETMLVGP